MSLAVKVVLALLLLLALEVPAIVFHSELSAERKASADYQKKFNDDEQSIGVLKAQLVTSQSDLAASQQANRASSLSIDEMKKDADNAAAEAASFRLAAAAQQATSGSIIRQRDVQIASLKAQNGGCDEAIADLRGGK